MKGDSKYILPIYARMMMSDKILDAIRLAPEMLCKRDLQVLASFGVPFMAFTDKETMTAKKSDLLDYILNEVVAFVKHKRDSNFRAMTKLLFFIRRDINRLLNKIQ